jgi:hypothetical protein
MLMDISLNSVWDESHPKLLKYQNYAMDDKAVMVMCHEDSVSGCSKWRSWYKISVPQQHNWQHRNVGGKILNLIFGFL